MISGCKGVKDNFPLNPIATPPSALTLYFDHRTAVNLPRKVSSAHVAVVQSTAPSKSPNHTSGSNVIPSDLQAVAASAAVNKPFILPGVNNLESNYTTWSLWSDCSPSCGRKAVMVRRRTCKLIGGKSCQGPYTQKKPCPFTKCPGMQYAENTGQ